MDRCLLSLASDYCFKRVKSLGRVALEETVESLQKRLEGNIAELVARGVNESRLRAQSMLTPSCGAGTLSIELTERIYALLNGLGQKMRGF